MMHVPGLIKYWFRNSKGVGGGYTHTDKRRVDFKSLLILFQNEESRMKVHEGTGVCLLRKITRTCKI
jgi:hypothetical protein